MAGIFISYRREDTQADARSLLLTLRQHFGQDFVFMDVTGILPGLDFRKEIDQWVQRCDVFLVVIGKRWVELQKARANDAHDFVRLETAGALRRGIPVIPVLVQGATMPVESELHEDLRDLCYRNAFKLHHENWDSDARALIADIETFVGNADTRPKQLPGGSNAASTPASAADVAPGRPPEAATGSKARRWAVAIAVVVAMIAGYLVIERGDGRPGPAGNAPPPAAVTEPGGAEPSPAPARVVVPKLSGLREAAARAALASAGLAAKTAHEDSEAQPPGVVLRTEPAESAAVASGSRVTLILAAAPSVPVPRLVGLDRAQAEQALATAGLRLGGVAEKPSAAAPGSVIGSTPAEGQRVRKGASIELTLAVAQIPSMPAVSSVSFPEARRVLGAARIRFAIEGSFMAPADVKSAQERGIYHPDGFVIRQAPPAGTPLAPGMRVTLWVLRPPPAGGEASASPPKSYSVGDLTVRGTWMADLDRGIETQDGADFWWQQATPTERYLTPKNGARFKVLGQRDFDRITYADLRERVRYGADRIDGSDGASNQLAVGTVVAYVTDQGRYGKLLVRAWGYNLSIRWVTYEAAR
jgi:beta-lactam-binding protein with PASTA domain